MPTSHPGLPLAYCTIVARNYLPQAMSLFTSVRAQQPEVPFHLLIVDGIPDGLSDEAGVITHHDLGVLGLADREVVNLAAIYDVVEISTGVKARFLDVLLDSYERVVYLDPDMWLVTPLWELPDAIDEHGIVLTPHILQPIPPGTSFISEGSSLTVGIHNLGFCAVGRQARPFLEWWWSHLQRECLIYPLLGLFVDQKWVDMGSVLFQAHSLRHPGYNIGHWNLHERRISQDAAGAYVVAAEHPARLMHFSGFDPEKPEEISVRQNESLQGKGLETDALQALSRVYADEMLRQREALGPQGGYRFATDTSGKPLSLRLRRTYRAAVLADPDSPPPSPFDPAEATAFARWRRRALPQMVQNALPDAAIAFKYAFPDTFKRSKRIAPRVTGRVRRALLDRAKVRR